MMLMQLDRVAVLYGSLYVTFVRKPIKCDICLLAFLYCDL